MRADPAERVDQWQAVASEAFAPVAVAASEEPAFAASVRGQRAGPLEVSSIRASAQRVERGVEHVRSGAADRFFVNLPLAEGASVTQDGRTARLRPGDFTLIDGGRPFQLTFGMAFTQISLAVPHEVLAARLGDAATVTATRVDGTAGAGAVAAGAIRALASTTMDAGSARAVASHLTGLIALALGDVRPAARPAGPRTVLREAALSALDAHLLEPALSPALVAARIGVSVRYLHALFADGGESFTRTVRRRRLELAQDLLADPTASVTEVALRSGFDDPSYFARAYKAHFGMTPTQGRARSS